MTRAPVLLLLACSLAGAADAPQLNESERKEFQKLAAQLPVEIMQTTPEVRERLRGEGRPVMTVQARPAYIQRAALRYADRFGTLQQPNERSDVEGCVIVSFEIRADGKTDAFEIVKAEPPGVFDTLALRTVFATEFEPPAESVSPGAAPAARPRHEKAVWFLVAGPPPGRASMLNEFREKERNERREARRAACEGRAP